MGNKQDKKLLQTKRIIELLIERNELPESDAQVIRQWLADQHNAEIKSEALLKVLFEAKDKDGYPRLGLETWPEVARRIGVDPDIIFNKHKAHPLRPARKAAIPLWRRASVQVAAVMLPVALAVGVWALHDKTREQPLQVAQAVTVSAPAGETKEITLSDGTVVRLAGESELTYIEGFADGRSVNLKGEARFAVAKASDEQGAALPFTVSTNTLRVNVHGTVFRVDEYPGAATSTVALYEGSVSIDNGAVTELRHGDLYEYDHNSQNHTIGIIPAREMLDNGQMPVLRFDRSLMSDLMLSLESNFGVRFAVSQGFNRSTGGISGDFEGLGIGDIVHILTVTDKKYAYDLGGNTIAITNKKLILDD